MSDDYLSLLDRAKAQLPETIEKHERFTVPEPDVFQEGKTTVLKNFGGIVDALRREPDHLLHYLLKELGTPGTVDGRRVIFKARLTPQQIKDRITTYTETFVPAYVAAFGEEPINLFHAHAYDAANLILDAIEAVGQETADGTLLVGRQALRDHLYATSGFQGLTGTLTCNETGDCADANIAVQKVEGGDFNQVWSSK
jgi:putative translation initiation factor aIF-2 beta subunit